MTPFPFSSGAWNSHGLRDYNMEGFNAFVGAILKDHDSFATAFAGKIFKDGVIPPGMDWLHEEMTFGYTIRQKWSIVKLLIYGGESK